MRPLRHVLSRPWELASGLTGLALLSLALVAFFNFNPNATALASNPVLTRLVSADQQLDPDVQTTRAQQFEVASRAFENRKSKIDNLLDNPFATHPVALKTPDPKADLKTYNGKTFRYLKTLTLRVTAYAPDPRCCYPYDGTTTASGLPTTTNGGRLVAADTSLIPLHWLVTVPGYAKEAPVPVLDRGGAIKGNKLDVLLPTFDQAKQWGVKNVQVKIYQPVK